MPYAQWLTVCRSIQLSVMGISTGGHPGRLRDHALLIDLNIHWLCPFAIRDGAEVVSGKGSDTQPVTDFYTPVLECFGSLLSHPLPELRLQEPNLQMVYQQGA
jgi:hypothetical protein